MNFDEYQRATQRTVPEDMSAEEILEMGVIGSCGEAGELAEVYKKHRFQGRELDVDRLANECGDQLWYLAQISRAIGVSLEEIARRNIAKLTARYPNGFSVEDSLRKADRLVEAIE